MAELNLRDNNLYATGFLVEYDDGEMELLLDAIEFDNEGDDIYHTLMEGDELTKLAQQKYGNIVEDAGKYWFLIAFANNIENPMDLDDLIGTELKIPNIIPYRLKLD